MEKNQNTPSAADIARELRAQEAAEKQAKNKKAAMGCLVLIGIIIGAGVIIWATSPEPEPAEVVTLPDGRTVDSAMATFMCESQVKDQLVSPSTAEFPGVFSGDYTRPTKQGNTWYQRIVVDSQNAFGATIRTEWDCDIHGPLGTITVTPRN